MLKWSPVTACVRMLSVRYIVWSNLSFHLLKKTHFTDSNSCTPWWQCGTHTHTNMWKIIIFVRNINLILLAMSVRVRHMHHPCDSHPAVRRLFRQVFFFVMRKKSTNAIKSQQDWPCAVKSNDESKQRKLIYCLIRFIFRRSAIVTVRHQLIWSVRFTNIFRAIISSLSSWDESRTKIATNVHYYYFFARKQHKLYLCDEEVIFWRWLRVFRAATNSIENKLFRHAIGITNNNRNELCQLTVNIFSNNNSLNRTALRVSAKNKKKKPNTATQDH